MEVGEQMMRLAVMDVRSGNTCQWRARDTVCTEEKE